ncbi:hypothetical protein L8378_004821, partial [Salmonella enterica]|nr:hypothetical protein [Salmonella enterica]
LISFFQLFDGNSTFTEGEFENAFNKFKIRNEKETNETPSITKDYISFLQFWYDVNVIGYKERIAEEKNNFYHWSYRERNALNVMPKIKKGCVYIIHPGIAKAIDIGKPTVRE